MSECLGNNINGPSLIRVPDWVMNPLGRYYLYFAHHEGRSIRLAFADDLVGPWTIYEPGALRIEHSLFPAQRSQISPSEAVLQGLAGLGIQEFVPHIASPDVLVDQQTRQIRMYFHGMVEDGDQKTRLAVSADGLNFKPLPPLFDHFYFRVFEFGGWHWAISWGGFLYRAAHPGGPFERGPPILERAPLCPTGTIMRHVALLRCGHRLHLFYSRIGDRPEVILHAEIELSDDWNDWRVGDPTEILRPVEDWEGADLPPEESSAGAAFAPVHALRDPCIFRDQDERTFLLYSGAAEQALGIVELEGL